MLDYAADKTAFDAHWKAANNLLLQIYNQYFPWAKTDTQPTRAYEELRERWIQMWGDPAEPETQERIENSVKLYKEHIAKKRKELEDKSRARVAIDRAFLENKGRLKRSNARRR